MTGKKIYLVSLGCPKNLVDSEMLLCAAFEEGWEITPDMGEADLLVVNTCGFIDDARRESLGCIRECLSEKKSRGRDGSEGPATVVAAGCMAEKGACPQSPGNPVALPGVDLVLGVGEVDRFRAFLKGGRPRRGAGRRRTLFPDGRHPRLLTGYGHSTYLKIGDGCSRRCAFCLIPAIRGRARSRRPAAVVDEAIRLASIGVKELVLVSQDTTAYGRDLGRPGARLVPLLEDLSQIEGIDWIRLLYLYPHESLFDLIDLMGRSRKIVPYLDLPVQHASDRMLKIMRRGHGRKLIDELLAAARAVVPGMVIRTTVIVGHPGETEEDFEELLDFLHVHAVERIGVMKYSDEPGTASFLMEGKVGRRTRDRRWLRIIDRASRILDAHNRRQMGKERSVMLEEPAPGVRGGWTGRLETQAPEIDGHVVVRGAGPGRNRGDIVRVRITGFEGIRLRARALL
jgi:ribosomal protein S12 methylthiotransferase